MERIFAKAEELVEDVKEYVDIRIESAKLSVAEKASMIIANTAAGIAVLIILIFFALLLVTGLALLIGEWLDKPWAGFLIMAGVCLLKAIIIWTARKKIIQIPVMNALIQQLFSNPKGNEEN